MGIGGRAEGNRIERPETTEVFDPLHTREEEAAAGPGAEARAGAGRWGRSERRGRVGDVREGGGNGVERAGKRGDS